LIDEQLTAPFGVDEISDIENVEPHLHVALMERSQRLCDRGIDVILPRRATGVASENLPPTVLEAWNTVDEPGECVLLRDDHGRPWSSRELDFIRVMDISRDINQIILRIPIGVDIA
jgi:hypothetical protein